MITCFGNVVGCHHEYGTWVLLVWGDLGINGWVCVLNCPSRGEPMRLGLSYEAPWGCWLSCGGPWGCWVLYGAPCGCGLLYGAPWCWGSCLCIWCGSCSCSCSWYCTLGELDLPTCSGLKYYHKVRMIMMSFRSVYNCKSLLAKMNE